MAHVILGLLLLADHSLYSLSKQFETGISLFYSASVGSIKRALDVLLARGWVEVAAARGPRGKRLYSVTDTGRAEFTRWMAAPLGDADAEKEALARTFFLGVVPPELRATALDNIAARVETDLDRLRGLAQQLDAQEIPAQWREVFAHQRATLDYGIGAHEFALGWFRRHAQSAPAAPPVPRQDEPTR